MINRATQDKGRQVSQAGVFAGPDPVLDAGVGPVPGFQERELPPTRVGREGLIPVTVADLEGVQGRAGVRVLSSDDHTHPGARLGPAGQVEYAGVLDDIGVLRRPPSALFAAFHACLGTSLIASRIASVPGLPTEKSSPCSESPVIRAWE